MTTRRATNAPCQPSSASRPNLLNYDDVSKITGLTVGTLRFLRHEGRGPRGFKLGRQIRFYETDVWAWIESKHLAEASRYDAGGAA